MTVLYSIVLYCIVLYSIVLYCFFKINSIDYYLIRLTFLSCSLIFILSDFDSSSAIFFHIIFF